MTKKKEISIDDVAKALGDLKGADCPTPGARWAVIRAGLKE